MTAKKQRQSATGASLSQKHLTGIAPLSHDDIHIILDRTSFYAEKIEVDRHYRTDTLRNHTVLTAFFENSTRTRLSFESAARRLGADIVNFETETSSLKKGETLMDTVLTLQATVQPDALIIRHSEYGAPDYIARHVDCAVINAGDSWREHPTQALLDAFTIQGRKGRIEGLNIAICGDIAHSRVAGSNLILLPRLGANVRLIAPPALLPQKLPDGIASYSSMEEGLKGCDIVMMLRLQKERMQAGLINSDRDYFRQYGLTSARLALANRDALVMHPGPMNRGVEIADEVADDPQRSLILEQVYNGVPTRMAVLELLLAGK